MLFPFFFNPMLKVNPHAPSSHTTGCVGTQMHTLAQQLTLSDSMDMVSLLKCRPLTSFQLT